MLKIAKNGLILHYVGSFGFSRIFFRKPPPLRLRPRRGPTGTKNFEFPPPIKNLEKKTLAGTCKESTFLFLPVVNR